MQLNPGGGKQSWCVAKQFRLKRLLKESEDLSLSVEFAANAIVAPLTKYSRNSETRYGIFDGGVYYSDGSICARGLHVKNNAKNVPLPFHQLNFNNVNTVQGGGG